MLNCSQYIKLLDSNSNAVAMAYVDAKIFRSYIGAALPVFTRSHDRKYCHSSLFPWHGAPIRDFRFGAELWFSGFIYSLPESTELN